MLTPVRTLVEEIAATRTELAHLVKDISDEEGDVKPAANAWSVSEVVEHLVWAEMGGLNSMTIAIDAWRRGDPVWKQPNPSRDDSIETIIRATWRPKEQVPEGAGPQWGGPLSYWVSVHAACQSVVEDVAARIREDELDDVVYPHPISGPLTMRQRLAFLRYHMQHHLPQVEGLRRHLGK